MAEVFISLGSNINPQENVSKALILLSAYVKILDVSTVYLTDPIGSLPQDDFYNCVVKVETCLEPHKLKSDVLRPIEDAMGRKRGPDKYTPRTIDIDIIVYDDLVISPEDLTLPDPDIMDRSFLAKALYELDPTLVLPNMNKSIKKIASGFKNRRMNPLKKYTEVLRNFVKTQK